MSARDSVVCSRCDNPLPEPVEDGPGPRFALVVRLDGGYGMFCDPGFEDSDDWARVLCHDCAHELCEFLGLDPRSWHAHVGERAWDVDHHAQY